MNVIKLRKRGDMNIFMITSSVLARIIWILLLGVLFIGNTFGGDISLYVVQKSSDKTVRIDASPSISGYGGWPTQSNPLDTTTTKKPTWKVVDSNGKDITDPNANKSTESNDVYNFLPTTEDTYTVSAVCGHKSESSDDYAKMEIKIAVIDFDLDVDSDNNGTVEPDNANEDDIEDIADDAIEPGKFVIVDNTDLDADGIPDNVDWKIQGNGFDENIFAEVKFRIKNCASLPGDTKIKIKYISSNPANLTGGNPAGGYLRLWKKPSNVERNTVNIINSGDFVAASTDGNASTYYTLDEIFGSSNDKDREVTMYLEAVRSSGSSEDITFALAVDSGIKDIVKVMPLLVNMGMDGNRDKTIEFGNYLDNQYTFWVNDDYDRMDILGQEDDINSSNKDCDDNYIGTQNTILGTSKGCKRDLEDFTQFHIKLDTELIKSYGNDMKLYLKADLVKVNLFKAVNSNFNYLSDQTSGDAEAQIEKEKFMTIDSTERELVLDSFNYSLIPFLLEGCQTGEGKIIFTVKYKEIEICKRELKLSLHPITWFYQKYALSDPTVTSAPPLSNGYGYTPETNDLILFVHGWRMAGEWEKERWAETIFKRLWWQGYKGHVGLFSWPSLGLLSYNESEYNGWRSATSLKNLLTSLNQGGYNGKIRILAHSQGNVIASEALHNMPDNSIHSFITTQAAIPGHCFDSSLTGTWTGYTTPDIFGHYFSGKTDTFPYFADVQNKTQNRIRMYNVEDFALSSWWVNNMAKPDIISDYYNYDGPNSEYNIAAIPIPSRFYSGNWPLDTTLYLPGNSFKIFSFCAESRTVALGAQPGSVTGFTSHNLESAPYCFDNNHYSHSKQFRSNITYEFGYWHTVINDSSLPVVPEK